MLATNVSFVVVAAELGVKAGLLSSSVASSMVLAVLLSAVLFPALAQSVLARTRSHRLRPPDAGSRQTRRTPVLSSAP